MICKISTSKTPRSCKILKNLSKTLTFCSFLCIGSFLGFSGFSDFFSLPLGWATSQETHTEGLGHNSKQHAIHEKQVPPISNLSKIQRQC